MKKLLIAACCIMFALSCSRKTVPPKPNTVLRNIFNDTVSNNNNNSGNVFSDTVATITNSSALVMVIADGYGRLITPQQNLPQDAAVTYNSLQLSKGFTVQQRANLQARYNTVPPRVLFVPQQYVSASLKGTYYIYRKKFWYWKKSDGLFYLDQKYYL